jgi:GNAT superfamily N-acetyltransferase
MTSDFLLPRPMTEGDLEYLRELDATVEVKRVLVIDPIGDEDDVIVSPLIPRWRALDEPRIEPNRLDDESDETAFAYRQIVRGMQPGIAWLMEVTGFPVATLAAVEEAEALRLVDIRVDYDERRQGYASAMLYRFIALAREREARLLASVPGDREAAMRLLTKCGFERSGLHADVRGRATIELRLARDV